MSMALAAAIATGFAFAVGYVLGATNAAAATRDDERERAATIADSFAGDEDILDQPAEAVATEIGRRIRRG